MISAPSSITYLSPCTLMKPRNDNSITLSCMPPSVSTYSMCCSVFQPSVEFWSSLWFVCTQSLVWFGWYRFYVCHMILIRAFQGQQVIYGQTIYQLVHIIAHLIFYFRVENWTVLRMMSHFFIWKWDNWLYLEDIKITVNGPYIIPKA